MLCYSKAEPDMMTTDEFVRAVKAEMIAVAANLAAPDQAMNLTGIALAMSAEALECPDSYMDFAQYFGVRDEYVQYPQRAMLLLVNRVMDAITTKMQTGGGLSDALAYWVDQYY